MKNYHPLKHLPDGSLNPRWKPRPSGPSGKSTVSGTSVYVPKEREFLSIDGEGINIAGVHTYVLLMCSDGSILCDRDGIDTRSAFDWLINLGIRHSASSKHLRKVFVGFSISYDVNMILKDVPWDVLAELHKDGWVVWNGYHITWKPTKEFIVSRWSHTEQGKRESIHIYDSFGFFQSSFIKAIEDWLGKDSPEYLFIAEQKSRRHEFVLSELPTIQRYCAAELDYLNRIMEKLETAVSACDLRLARYDGAGAIASALIRKHRIKKHMESKQESNTIANMVRSAYFGGRIEQLQYGTSKNSWDYDINSAYVKGLTEVPNLQGGVWKRWSDDKKLPTPFSLVHCRWNFLTEYPFYPFPYRQPNGFAQFPQAGAGWYWGVEVLEPYLRFPEYITVDEWWEFLPLTNEKPYAFLKDLYEQRARWKANNNQAEKALKLGMNSLYGKHAQHVGWTTDRVTGQRKPPSTHQLEYAGFTTAYTRAALWLQAMQNPDAIIAFQTDGIYSSERLYPIISTKLGEWSEKDCETSVFVQSGVYFTHADTKRELCYSRGFDQRDRGDGSAYLTLRAVRDGWKAKASHINVGCTRFVTFSSGVSASSLREHWRSWRTVDRKLGLGPTGTKRMSLDTMHVHYDPMKRLVPTIALDNLNPNDSEPYPLPWEPYVYEMDGIPDRIIERELTESEE